MDFLETGGGKRSTQVEHLVDLVDLVEHTGGPNRSVRTKIREQGASVGLGGGTVVWLAGVIYWRNSFAMV